jgi:hypothetical protein
MPSNQADSTVYHARHKLGIAFNKSNGQGAGQIIQALKNAGVPYTATPQITDDVIFIEILPGLSEQGVPISETFVRKVGGLGGRFSGGAGLASLLNRINRTPA